MIGRLVKHSKFGMGRIIKYDSGKITVDFSGSAKLFQFPEAFESFLTTEDAVLLERVISVQREKAESKKREEEERQKAKEVEEAAQAIPRLSSSEQAGYYTRKAHGQNESIAFKCNYCDGGSSRTCVGFRGACSDWMINYNIEKAKRVWCSVGSVCKKYHEGGISRKELDTYRDPNGKYACCYESGFFENWTMGAGMYHTGERADTPMHMNRINRGSLAVMTTRKPEEPESARFVFAVFLINSAFSGDDREEGCVIADPVWRIELMPDQAEKILFWNYYANANKPEKIVFGSGLHRYLTDIEAAQILRDISDVRGDGFSRAFLTRFCEINGIDPTDLEAPSGALTRRKQQRV